MAATEGANTRPYLQRLGMKDVRLVEAHAVPEGRGQTLDLAVQLQKAVA
jgi:hypothetical protein